MDALYCPLSIYVNQNARERPYGTKIGVLCVTWKKNWQGSALYMFSSYIYTKSLWSTDFQKALSGIHCMMIVTPNDEHLRSVRPLRQALSMIVHFTYQRTGSLALWCHIPPCFVYNHWLLTFGGGFWLSYMSKNPKSFKVGRHLAALITKMFPQEQDRGPLTECSTGSH